MVALAVVFVVINGRGSANDTDVNVLIWGNPYGLPESPHGGNLLHVWNMSFVEIKEHLPYIARTGFNTIQTSPIGESINAVRGRARPWWILYQPTYFRIGNALGTEEEFRAMTRLAATYGIHVIVDAIPNHTTATWDRIDPFLRYHEPPLFHSSPGNTPWGSQITNWYDREQFVRGNLLSLWDFYTGSPYFQALYMEFLGEIIDAGAAGFRYDAAHHIELHFDDYSLRSDFWPNITQFVEQRVRARGGIPFQYGEVLGGGGRQNLYIYDLPGFLVSSYAHSLHIRGSVDHGRLIDGQDGWNSTDFHIRGSSFGITHGNLENHVGTADRTVPWVECHDHYGNDGVSRHLTNEQIAVGWALITARVDTSPLFFIRPGDTAGFVNNGNMFRWDADANAFHNVWGHSIFYRHPVIAAINWFANDFKFYPEATSTHGTVGMIQRGPAGAKTGAVLANVGDTPINVNFAVQLANGNYTCSITGLVFSVTNGRLTGPAISGVSVLVLRYDPDAVFDEAVIGAYPGVDYTDLFGGPGDAAAAIRIEFVTDQPWQEIGLWSWPTNVSATPWPGDVRFTWDSSADAWVFYLPAGFDIAGQTFIINNAGGGSGQTAYISMGRASRVTWVDGRLVVENL